MKKLLKNCLLNNQPANILINGEFIESINSTVTSADRVMDMSGKIVIPAMIDLHAHIRDMELAYKEDWTTAGKAAFSGGVSTVFDMPNTLPPTTTLKHLARKREAAAASIVNYGIYAGATEHNLKDLREMLETGGIAGIKIFLAASSSNEVITNKEHLWAVFALAKAYDKPVLSHCELHNCIITRERQFSAEEYNHARYHSTIRDRKCAYNALKLVLELASEVGNSLVVLHISSKEEMRLVKEYKQYGDFPLYCEVTPHHLFLTENIIEKAGNAGKVNPPLRTQEDCDALMEAVLEGGADTIGSDHAPHSREEKLKEYKSAPSGFPGLETSLSLLMNNHLRGHQIPLETIVRMTSTNPAKIMKIKNRGEIREGNYADIAVIDPKEEWTVNPENFKTKAKYSPYSGFSLRGKVVQTFINGEEFNPKGKEVTYG